LERDLFAFLRQRLPTHLCPVQFTIHPELPRTITGKIRRGQLDSQDPDSRNCVDR
jgi:acyl-coenzyme A synthetase/AMP-(fatty) acid ligase